MLRYFPSCKFTAARQEVSMRVKEYMASRGAAVMGCCRPGREEVSPGDLAVTICESCNIIISEGRPGAGMMSLSQWGEDHRPGLLPLPDKAGRKGGGPKPAEKNGL